MKPRLVLGARRCESANKVIEWAAQRMSPLNFGCVKTIGAKRQ
jgi:hypothetical protein